MFDILMIFGAGFIAGVCACVFWSNIKAWFAKEEAAIVSKATTAVKNEAKKLP